MSQFIIFFKENSKLKLIQNILSIKIDEDAFLKHASQYLFPHHNKSEIWTIIDKNDESSDFLFTEAQEQLIQGNNFKSTRLANSLQILMDYHNQTCLWYASDWDNLPYVEYYSVITTVEKQLIDASGEVYLRF